MPSSQPLQTTLILGGGLAGIAAAVRLAQAGRAVTLVETRKRLGGRATSFVDPTTKETLDNCQHVLVGCCTNLMDLYRRLGVADAIEWHRRLYFALTDRKGETRIDQLEADDLPAPLHMTRSMLGFKNLTLAEKVAISRGMLAMMRMGKDGREALHHVTFAQWLEAQSQPAGAIRKFWAVVVISAINELPERMSAGYAIQVFQEAFLSNAGAYVMGLSSVPLVELYGAAERLIASAGGRVMLGRSVERLHFDGHRVTGAELDGGEKIEADHFISALPFDRLAKVCPPEMFAVDARLHVAKNIGVSPIIGIHLWLERADGRPAMELPHVILMDSPLQWVFNKGMDEPPSRAQHLHGVISAAHDLVDTPAEEIAAMTVAEVRKIFPAARDARLVHSRVVKEKRATFSALPGLEAIRPRAVGAIDNLLLAGDWVKTGWPATMEGAVRSGYIAAAAAMGNDKPEASLVADMKPSQLYTLIEST